MGKGKDIAENSIRIEEEIEKAKEAIITEIANRPPTIGLIGVSGTGKSSTINSLFGTQLPISDVVACTKEFRDCDIDTKINEGEAKGHKASLRVVDAPGLGEDITRDSEYLSMYHEHLPKCDVILWVLTARNRAIALDQMYLEKLSMYHDRIVFGINAVDLIEPLDWERTNLPSDKQMKNMDIIVRDRSKKLQVVVKKEIKVIPYSAKKRYNLSELFKSIIESCPPSRKWIFGALKNFSAYDGVPPEVREKVQELVESQRALPTKTKQRKSGFFRTGFLGTKR